MSTLTTTLRNTDLQTLGEVLKDQHARKLDLVIPASKLAVVADDTDVKLAVPDPDGAVITTEGVTSGERMCHISNIAQGHLAARTGVPVTYLKRLREDQMARFLYLANVNHWLQRDEGNVLLRTFVTDDGGGFVRALMSDRFSTFDNLDALLAVLEGFRASGVNARIRSADLTEGRMVVRFECPDVNIDVADLVDDYRAFGRSGKDFPLMWAGLVLANSETGGSALTLSRQAVLQVCSNGMTVSTGADLRQVHLGQRLDAGVVNWSQDTITKTAQAMSARAADVVRTIVSGDWLPAFADELRAAKGIEVKAPEKTIKVVGKHLAFTEAQTDALLAEFIRGGDLTALGVVQAVTALAQQVESGDLHTDMEAMAMSVVPVVKAAA